MIEDLSLKRVPLHALLLSLFIATAETGVSVESLKMNLFNHDVGQWGKATFRTWVGQNVTEPMQAWLIQWTAALFLIPLQEPSQSLLYAVGSGRRKLSLFPVPSTTHGAKEILRKAWGNADQHAQMRSVEVGWGPVLAK